MRSPGVETRGISVIPLAALCLSIAASAGCAQSRIASYCRYVDDEGLARYADPCTPMRPGEYIVSLGKQTEVAILDELYGEYGIRAITEVSVPAEYGRQHVRRFLLVLRDDPGPETLFEIASKASGLFRPYVNITPNREAPPEMAEAYVSCVVAGERQWTLQSNCD